MNENMVWTDSQDYGADEILSHPFTLTQTVQRAACALPFEGSVPTRTNRNHSINQIFPLPLTYLISPKGVTPDFPNHTITQPNSSLFQGTPNFPFEGGVHIVSKLTILAEYGI